MLAATRTLAPMSPDVTVFFHSVDWIAPLMNESTNVHPVTPVGAPHCAVVPRVSHISMASPLRAWPGTVTCLYLVAPLAE